MEGAEVDVLEESDHVGFSGLLEAVEGGGLEPELGVVPSGDLTYKSLERKLLHESLGAFLVPISNGDE